MVVDKQKIERVISSINKFKTLSQIQDELSLDDSGLQDYEIDILNGVIDILLNEFVEDTKANEQISEAIQSRMY